MCRFFEYTAFLIHTHTPAFPAGVAPSALTSSNTATKENRAFYYDARGRVVQQARTNAQGGTATETLSYTYSGPKRTNTGWQYDNHGNLTADPQAGLSVAWNAIDLPRTLTSGSAGTSRAYLADGTLAQIYDGSTTRLYLGDLVFTRTGTSGTPARTSTSAPASSASRTTATCATASGTSSTPGGTTCSTPIPWTSPRSARRTSPAPPGSHAPACLPS